MKMQHLAVTILRYALTGSTDLISQGLHEALITIENPEGLWLLTAQYCMTDL